MPGTINRNLVSRHSADESESFGLGRIRSIGEAIDWIDHLDSRQKPLFDETMVALRRAEASGKEADVTARAAFAAVLSSEYLLLE